MSRSPQLAAKRVLQTLTAFQNGPRVLWDLSMSRTPWSSDVVTFHSRAGARISCPNVPGARVPVYELFAEDAYRFSELTAGLRPDFAALDIGAQVGCFTVALAQFAPRARAHAYEASPSTATWLRRNITANRLDDRVVVHNIALADHVGSMQFPDNGQGSGLNGLTAPDGANVLEVPCTTFAEAVATAGGRVDLVKIDTEGAEYGVVLTSAPRDWATVMKVVLEYHQVPGRTWAELHDFFSGLGFHIQRHESVEAGIGAVWLSRER